MNDSIGDVKVKVKLTEKWTRVLGTPEPDSDRETDECVCV